MAQRRMFSQRIINSGRFLQMSQSAQALYFHLSMRADDDGIVEAYPVMKLVNSADDDFKVLVAKYFIKPLNDDFVSYITDWSEHNLIRPDRKIDSIYKDMLVQILPDAKIIEPKPRSDVKNNSKRLTGRSTDGPRTTKGPHRLGKVRLGKVKNTGAPSAPDVPIIIDLFKEVNPSYNRLFGSPPQRSSVERLIKQYGVEKLTAMISYLPKSNASKFAPTITTPVQFEQKLGELIAWSQKQKDLSSTKKTVII